MPIEIRRFIKSPYVFKGRDDCRIARRNIRSEKGSFLVAGSRINREKLNGKNNSRSTISLQERREKSRKLELGQQIYPLKRKESVRIWLNSGKIGKYRRRAGNMYYDMNIEIDNVAKLE